MRYLPLIVVLLFGLAAPAAADDPAAEVEAKIYEHIRLWNAGDAEAIFQRIFDPGGVGPFSSVEVLQRNFDTLEQQGYGYSTILSTDACLITETTALVQLRYSRHLTSGEVMGPAERSTLYVFEKGGDGWRATNLIGFNPAARIDCASPPGIAGDLSGEAGALLKMREYLTLWNSQNAAAVIERVYRMENSPIGTVAGLQSNFDSLTSQGYDYSEELGMDACMLAADSALVRFRFTRFLNTGEVMGPRERTSHYMLRRFDDGWRITQFASAEAVASSGCAFS